MSRLEKRLISKVMRASKRYALIEPDDRIMVGLSGGKDSYVLLHLLRKIQVHTPFKFEVFGLNLDQGFPGYDPSPMVDYLTAEGYDFEIQRQDTFSVVKEKAEPGKSYCSICARLRRGVIYRVAKERGATKIALGHHRDDAIETLLLNLFFAGKMASMPPKLLAEDGNVLIRPMIDVDEADVRAFAQEMAFPILPGSLCGSPVNLQRDRMKALVAELKREIPRIKGSMMAAIRNVEPSHLHDLALYERFDVAAFRGLREEDETPA